MKPFLVEEPNLFFRNRNECVDPRVGMLNFGPNGLDKKDHEITLGVIGTRKSIINTKDFFNRLKYDIPGKYYENSNVRSIDFPGVDKGYPLGYYFKFDENYIQHLPEDTIAKLNSDETKSEKIKHIGEQFKIAIEDLGALHPKPDVVIIAYPEVLVKNCAISRSWNRIKLSNRTFQDLQRISNMDQNDRPPFYDLHNYLKVVGFQNNLKTQIMYPNTIKFDSDQDPATIAWNLTSTLYYKSTNNPWKLSDLEPETIHVGISFFNDFSDEQEVILRAAVAQVYMRTGDSQVIRGLEIPVTEEQDRSFELSELQSENILAEAINLYQRQHRNTDPDRVVLYKSSPYSNFEIEGFDKATQNIPIIDYVHIKRRNNFRFLTPKTYPIVRGSGFHYNDKFINKMILYTVGYVSALDTYPGSGVPRPLEIDLVKTDSSYEKLAYDIMNLSKLDWNSSAFCKDLPVTISTSRKVGEIMAEVSLVDNSIKIPTAYSDYI